MKKTPDPKTFYNEEMPGKLGTDYEHARWHADAFKEAQYRMMQKVMRTRVAPYAKRAHRILEVGPGPGTWTKMLFTAAPKATYTLVDISAEMLARAQGNLPKGYAVSFVESDFLAFKAAEHFDFIFSSRALEYMPNKEVAVAKIASLLSPGGITVIITKMPKAFFEKVTGKEVSALHTGQIAPRALVGLFAENGLHIRTVRIATATLPGVKSPSLNRLVFALLSKLPLWKPFTVFAESYLVIAEKT